ncbi:MAG: C1 family peptidase [Polyangiaceae bacterium]
MNLRSNFVLLSSLALAVLSGCSADTTPDDGAAVGTTEQALAANAARYRTLLGDTGRPKDYEKTVLKRERLAKVSFPAQYNWADSGVVTPAKQQGGCGSCWAFAAVGALEAKLLMMNEPAYDLSELQQVLCNNSASGCAGGSMSALRYWETVGPQLESCTQYNYSTSVCQDIESCPQLPYRTTQYYTVDMSSNDNIKTSLMEDGPTYFRFDVYSDFFTYWDTAAAGAVYSQATGNWEGGHAVLLIGWDDAKGAWLCKNSWGETAGPNDDGTFWIAYGGHTTSLGFGMSNVKVQSASAECSSDADCADDNFCNGQELCWSGTCEAGMNWGTACENATPLNRYQYSGDLGTTGPKWYVISDDINGWWTSGDATTRIIRVNGEVVKPGQTPLPAKVGGKRYFHFSAGSSPIGAFGTW